MPELWLPGSFRHTLIPDGPVVLSDGRTLEPRVEPLINALGGRAWVADDGLKVIASADDTGEHGRLLHVSCSYYDRNPSWDDIKAVRETFFPSNLDVMMVLPKKEDYVNVHPHTFHLWQTPSEWGIR